MLRGSVVLLSKNSDWVRRLTSSKNSCLCSHSLGFAGLLASSIQTATAVPALLRPTTAANQTSALDDFVPLALRKTLLAQLPGPEALGPTDPILRQSTAIPAYLHSRIMAVLHTGDVNSQSDGAHADDATSAVDVPAHLSMAGVKLHQDKYISGATVQGLVAAVYLAGNGNMTFVHAYSQKEHSCFEIAPGRLIVWNNSQLMHKVEVGPLDVEFRVMLGPMSLDSASTRGNGVVQVGIDEGFF